jgi:integrase
MAKILTDQQIESLLAVASLTRSPDRNRVIVLLSIKAGLRASEIANLTWDMVVCPTGEVERVLELHNRVAKNMGGRRIPLHPDLRAALVALRGKTPTPVGNNGQRCYFDLLLGLERVCFCALDSLIPRTSAQGSPVAFFWSGTFFIADL